MAEEVDASPSPTTVTEEITRVGNAARRLAVIKEQARIILPAACVVRAFDLIENAYSAGQSANEEEHNRLLDERDDLQKALLHQKRELAEAGSEITALRAEMAAREAERVAPGPPIDPQLRDPLTSLEERIEELERENAHLRADRDALAQPFEGSPVEDLKEENARLRGVSQRLWFLCAERLGLDHGQLSILLEARKLAFP